MFFFSRVSDFEALKNPLVQQRGLSPLLPGQFFYAAFYPNFFIPRNCFIFKRIFIYLFRITIIIMIVIFR